MSLIRSKLEKYPDIPEPQVYKKYPIHSLICHNPGKRYPSHKFDFTSETNLQSPRTLCAHSAHGLRPAARRPANTCLFG